MILACLLWCFAIQSAAQPSEDYFQYHQQFNAAMQMLAEENFQAAETQLDSLFAKFSYVFTKDYVIAAQVAMLNQHEEQAIHWLSQAIQGGYLKECIHSIPILRPLLNQTAGQTLIQQYDALRAHYLSRIRLDLLYHLSNRYVEEQMAKRSRAYIRIVEYNFQSIKILASELGFPGERYVGIDYAKMAQGIDDCAVGNAKVVVTLLHYPYPIAELGEAFFVEAIQRGELHPREFAHIYNYEAGRVSVLYKQVELHPNSLPQYYFNLAFGPKTDDQQQVDLDRRRFGIIDLATDRRLQQLERQYGLQLYFGYK